jgi:leader peptidase (prepilin peptidase)/N-methyltransferase
MMYAEIAAEWPWLFYIAATFLGLCVGSFLNVVVYRLPVMMEREWRSECEALLQQDTSAEGVPNNDNVESPEDIFNLAYPPSRCPKCSAAIKPWQNIPVLSYLILRGRCAGCATRISFRYPAVEFMTGALSLLLVWVLGLELTTLAYLILLWCLIALTLIDFDTQLLPDQITLPLMWGGILFNLVFAHLPLADSVLGAVFGYLSLWSVYWLFKLLTGKEGMGYGDFKLLAALGAWMGWQQLPLIIILSSLVGAICGSIILFMSKRSQGTAIPFGPYLATAGLIALLWGSGITSAYLNYAGLR